jgi:hypothetical protein
MPKNHEPRYQREIQKRYKMMNGSKRRRSEEKKEKVIQAKVSKRRELPVV